MKPESLKQDCKNTLIDQCLETAIVDHAIKTFPYFEAFEKLPGFQKEQVPVLLSDMVSTGMLKIGFYFEELQDYLTIFYFLRAKDDCHIVLGMDPKELSVSISPEIKGVFRLSEEQYVNLFEVPHC